MIYNETLVNLLDDKRIMSTSADFETSLRKRSVAKRTVGSAGGTMEIMPVSVIAQVTELNT